MADMNRSGNEKEQVEARLRQLQELKSIGLLAGGIVHSFNNSIGVVRGYADLALRTTSSSDRSYAYLKQIIEETDLAQKLAGKMLIFTRQKKPEFKLVNIHSLLQETIKIFKESLAAPIDIQQDIDPMCPAVLADADQIRQVVINLCNNAFDAMSENGGILKIILKEVNVDASFAEEHERLNERRCVKLTVCDTGHGMDQNILKQMYQPFFTTKKAGEGAGLGLTVVHEIVSGHTGKIFAESKLGEGTTFDIYLPLVNQDHKILEE